MPISSLILRFNPSAAEPFMNALSAVPGVTLLEQTPEAVAVLLEADTAQTEWQVAQQLPALPGCRGVEILMHVPDEAKLGGTEASAVPDRAMGPSVSCRSRNQSL